MNRSFSSAVCLAGCCVILLMMSACGPPPVEERAALTLPETFSNNGTEAPVPEWWTAFNDPVLNQLIERSLENNYGLRATWDRLDQARALARINGAAAFPSVSVSGSAGRTLNAVIESDGGISRSYTNSIKGTVSASYELDLWGRVRGIRRASLFDAQASAEDLRAASISLAGEVTSVWYRLVEARAQTVLLHDQISLNESYLELVKTRFQQGQVSAADVLQLQQAIEAGWGELALAKSGLEILEHQLAVLCGAMPGADVAPPIALLPQIPPQPASGIPVDLIRSRPDVRSSYLKVMAADRRLGSAVAARFPTISFTARAEVSGDSLGNVFDNWLGNLAANLLAPVFDGGRLAAESDRSRAAASEALNKYRSTVLKVLQEVEDALVREREQGQYINSLLEQLTLSQAVIDRTRSSFEQGAVDYLRVLSAVQSHQRLERTLLSAQLNAITMRINLYRALASGWDLKRPDTASEYNNSSDTIKEKE